MTNSPLREALTSVSATADRLGELSRRHYQNPYEFFGNWPDALDPAEAWCSSPELLSLYGTPYWATLDQDGQRALAFHEAANFFSLNIHGEKGLMAGLATRLYRPDLADVTRYLHNFLDEENKHSIYFGEFCHRYAQIYRSRQVDLGAPRRPADQEDLLFFAKTMIFEELVDHYNQQQARDERLHPVVRFINHNHHVEEARHLVFGRRVVAALWRDCAPGWGEEVRAEIRAYLAQFLTMGWREYYNPDVYAACGFTDPWAVAEDAWNLPAQRAHRRRMSARCLGFLRRNGLLEGETIDAF